jgi:hypothetical protein
MMYICGKPGGWQHKYMPPVSATSFNEIIFFGNRLKHINAAMVVSHSCTALNLRSNLFLPGINVRHD